MSDSKFDPYEQQALIELLRIGEQEKSNGRFLSAEILFAEIEQEDNSIVNGTDQHSCNAAALRTPPWSNG